MKVDLDPRRQPVSETCVCGLPFSVDHAFNCPRGGFPSICHNELRDITASLMKEVCHNVTIEPILQPLSGETLHPRSAIVDDNACSDVRAEGFWDCRQQNAYFDVKVFNPTAATYRNKTLQSCYHRLEAGKRREYQECRTRLFFAPHLFHRWWHGFYCLCCLPKISLSPLCEAR